MIWLWLYGGGAAAYLCGFWVYLATSGTTGSY